MSAHKLLKSKMGVTIGVVWGVNLLLLALMFMLFGIGAPFIALLSGFYVGYAGTLIGGLIGFVLPGAVLVLYTIWTRDLGLWLRLHMGKGLILFFAITAPWFILIALKLNLER